jgi:hypothetical protein
MFAGQLGASSQAASGQLLPVWSDEGHFLEQSLARLKTTQPGGGADRPYEQIQCSGGYSTRRGGYAFHDLRGCGCLRVLFNHAKAAASAFQQALCCSAPKTTCTQSQGTQHRPHEPHFRYYIKALQDPLIAATKYLTLTSVISIRSLWYAAHCDFYHPATLTNGKKYMTDVASPGRLAHRGASIRVQGGIFTLRKPTTSAAHKIMDNWGGC